MACVRPSSPILLILLASIISVPNTMAQDSSSAKTEAGDALNFKMKSIDGDEVDLEKYKGNVVLVVNVASRCGLTKQYAGLQKLHEEYADQGLSILGFPCNQFGGQEPGTETEIKTFCSKNYGVTFDMFSKVDVNGDDRCDLYAYLTELDTEPKKAGNITWNFEKFVIDRDGKVIARFHPKVTPDNDDLLALIKKELAEK